VIAGDVVAALNAMRMEPQIVASCSMAGTALLDGPR
jgi:biotin carboxyl carrier protein